MMFRSVSKLGLLRYPFGASFVTYSMPLRQETSGLVTGKTSGSGFLSAFGVGGHGGTPMTEPFPGTVDPFPIPAPKQPPKTELTTLANGFKVASEDTWGATSCIGLAIASGSQNESPDVSGASQLLEYFAFKGTHNRTHFRVLQEFTGMGANIAAHSSREQMYYSVECLKNDIPAAVEVLCDTVFNPRFNSWELEEVKALVKNDIDILKLQPPQQHLHELLTGAVYSGGLGNPFHNTETTLESFTPEKIAQFHQQNFTPNRMVLSVAGIDHDTIVKVVEPTAGALPEGVPYTAPMSSYVGGEYKQPTGDKLCHVIIGFDVQGGWEDIKAACSMTVLLYLMGGGGSFSSGGPGKGMHSRLYLNVLAKYGWVHNFSAISQPFDKRCLAGVYGVVSPEWAPKLIDVMSKELTSLSQTITKVELERAKKAAIGQVLMTLENRSVAAEDIGRQVLTYGHRYPPQVFIEGLEKVTENDLKLMVSSMLKTPLSMASVGNISYMPRYTEVARRFG